MITPTIQPGPVPGQIVANPAATRAAGGTTPAPIIEPGQPRGSGSDPAADPRRVPPPPRFESIRPQPASRGDRADAADGQPGFRRPAGPDATPQGGGPGQRFGQYAFEEVRSERPRPSSTFLAQAIGQELDDDPGAGGGDTRSPHSVAALYRQTREVVDRARFRGLTPPPLPTEPPAQPDELSGDHV